MKQNETKRNKIGARRRPPPPWGAPQKVTKQRCGTTLPESLYAMGLITTVGRNL